MEGWEPSDDPREHRPKPPIDHCAWENVDKAAHFRLATFTFGWKHDMSLAESVRHFTLARTADH